MFYSNYPHEQVKPQNFYIDDASKILGFDIYHINKNLKVNNELFNSEVTKKLIKKVKDIKKFYDEYIKEDHKKKLKDFLEANKTN